MINLDVQYEPTALLSGSPLFDPIDKLFDEDSFDKSFIPHIKYGPLENIEVVEVLYTEFYYREQTSVKSVVVQFSWDAWEFQLELDLYGGHDCPGCKCVDDVDERIVDHLELLEWSL